MHVLALNSGSSTLKFGLYRVQGEQLRELASETLEHPDRDGLMARVERVLLDGNLPRPDAIGHRIVHGGPSLPAHCLIDAAVLRHLMDATGFAPLHMPAALSLLDQVRAQFPELPQVACFDTSFHAGMPQVAQVLALPRELRSSGIRRYGFHGLSCESILHQLAPDPPARVVIAHLGSGASVTAVRDGRSVDTSMGLTPSGGIIMATRSGDLDPGVLFHLMRSGGLDVEALEQLLNHRSGLLGISGLSRDMRELHRAESSNPDAALAIRMFCSSVRKQIAGMITALDGIDALIFTGGIGEHDPAIRAEICAGLSWMGIALDDARNRAANDPLNSPSSRCAIRVLASCEDEQIARHTEALVRTLDRPPFP